jgi:hypothetical protein
MTYSVVSIWGGGRHRNDERVPHHHGSLDRDGDVGREGARGRDGLGAAVRNLRERGAAIVFVITPAPQVHAADQRADHHHGDRGPEYPPEGHSTHSSVMVPYIHIIAVFGEHAVCL